MYARGWWVNIKQQSVWKYNIYYNAEGKHRKYTQSRSLRNHDVGPYKTWAPLYRIKIIVTMAKHINHARVPCVMGICRIRISDEIKMFLRMVLYIRKHKDNIQQGLYTLQAYRPMYIGPITIMFFYQTTMRIIGLITTCSSGTNYGFRKKHSTELAVFELIGRITNQLDKGLTPMIIYLDLSKAFDTLDDDIQKLQYYTV